MINEQMTDKQLFEVLSNMTCELRDGHVNLSAAHNVSRYGRWFDDYPMNQSDSLERRYLGRSDEYQQTSGLKYRILPDNVGYIRCASFDYAFGSGNLHEIMSYLSTCTMLIVDVRSNGGGMLTSAEKLASLFINDEIIGGYMCHKQAPPTTLSPHPRPYASSHLKGCAGSARWQCSPIAAPTVPPTVCHVS